MLKTPSVTVKPYPRHLPPYNGRGISGTADEDFTGTVAAEGCSTKDRPHGAAASVVGTPHWTLYYGVPPNGPLNPRQPIPRNDAERGGDARFDGELPRAPACHGREPR